MYSERKRLPLIKIIFVNFKNPGSVPFYPPLYISLVHSHRMSKILRANDEVYESGYIVSLRKTKSGKR